VPLGTAELCLEAIRIAAEVATVGNPASVSDAGVAALVGAAGVEGAVYNVRINLPSIKDADFCAEMERDLDRLVREARAARDAVDAYVLEQIRKK
jgi:formiminotetrahydrofolate cyclodeaminase